MAVTCLVDVEGGKDLAAVCIKGCDKMTIEEISEYIKDRASKIRNKQDFEHNKRTNSFFFIPTAYFLFLFQ